MYFTKVVGQASELCFPRLDEDRILGKWAGCLSQASKSASQHPRPAPFFLTPLWGLPCACLDAVGGKVRVSGVTDTYRYLCTLRWVVWENSPVRHIHIPYRTAEAAAVYLGCWPRSAGHGASIIGPWNPRFKMPSAIISLCPYQNQNQTPEIHAMWFSCLKSVHTKFTSVPNALFAIWE